MQLSETEYHQLRLFRSHHVGPIIYQKLITKYGSAKEALLHFDEINKTYRKSLKPADEKKLEAEIKSLEKAGGQFVFSESGLFPSPLKFIDDTPPVLSVLGNAEALNTAYIAIVGNRQASRPAIHFTHKIAKELCEHNFGVISGLARGIDTAAHQGALSANGLTIAVLAGGVNHIYPFENKKLYYDIIEKNGAIISEMPFGTVPTQNHFPRRNRIVSGISLGVAVIECVKRSGSLITARLALEQNRDVFAVPGNPIEKRSEGPNHLIRSGAHMLTSVEDILQNHTTWIEKESIAPSFLPQHVDFKKSSLAENLKTLNIKKEETLQLEPSFSSLAEEILSTLSSANSTSADDLIQNISASETDIFSALSELELDEKIERTATGFIVR